ncbi:RIPOR family member 3 isoform X5 [Protopterus annectens]|uniref:RIPOR family member 3 isoform X5 n=1 Tax=Protopterus annectens TaxID=7888 RepID=UPI001CF9B8A6|nr:RIPOR family member 3 isoform X5 [Protopterus annectens]
MSVKLKFVSPADGRGVTRSRSFAGFSPLASTKSRNYTVCGTSVRSKMSPVKSVKVYPPLHKGSGGMVPQPQQVEKIVRALRRGLNEYLELRQIELDFLTSQQKDTKRNSRLAFLYDLDKQTRSIERYIRKLEFHISKVEELYESYCLHRRLRDGASSMKQAFSSSSRSTKASRESLVELHRNFKECTEDMCILEGALETHLGEFYIRMKGLVGFARLCPGDQYEVFLKLGHQKWKLKGKIEADDRQLWDEEEVVFVPYLHENFEIKVTELRGLMTILVGTVTCDTASFFSARTQIMIVDITELGTIKLKLEVLWDPFDSGENYSYYGTTNKFSLGSRKASVYSWTPPNSPNFREKYYISKVLQQRSSSMESLTVETALDSFNFLDTQFSDDLSSLGSIRLRNTPTGTLHEGTLRNFGMLKDSLASGLRVPEELPLTTENDNVDMTLMIHLQVCNRLLQELASTKLANSVQNIVEELSHQTEVFEKLYAIYLEKAGNVKSAADVVPKTRKLKSALKFWNECTYSGTPLYCTADRMERRFLLNFKGKIKTKYHSYIDKVFKRFVEQISTSCGLLSSSAFPDVITLFQFCRYLNKRCAMGVAEQLDRLAKEVSLIEALQSPGRLKTLKKLKGKQISQLQPLHQTLKLLCALQLEENVRVSKAAKMGLLKASANRFFREKGVVYYTSLLKDRDVRLQQAACLALKLLKVKKDVWLLKKWIKSVVNCRHHFRNLKLKLQYYELLHKRRLSLHDSQSNAHRLPFTKHKLALLSTELFISTCTVFNVQINIYN